VRASYPAEEIVVTESRRAVDTESTTLGSVMTKSFLERIPAGRTYQSAVQTVPGVTSSTPVAAAPPPPPPVPQAPPPEGGRPQSPAVEPRMVHHDGFVALLVDDPAATLDAAIAAAKALGGRTERLAGTTVTLRIPVDRFDQAWEQILALGEVQNQLVRSDDITDQYTALDLREKLLIGTRDRLIALLARAQTEHEKLSLIAEIARISEELDVLRSQLQTLTDLASMPRITLTATARPAYVAAVSRPDAAGMEWVSALSPFRRGVWDDDTRVELPVPDQMVALSAKGPFKAETPGGTVWWTMQKENDPLGAGAFWVSTIEARLADEFANPTRSRVGAWDCLALDEPQSEKPYRWKICVQAQGRKLLVSQVYLPDADQIARYADAIDASLKGVGEGS
jgi:hypothetical protein